jgi:hypothetical protein
MALAEAPLAVSGVLLAKALSLLRIAARLGAIAHSGEFGSGE